MLDKNKIYIGYSGKIIQKNQSPSKRFKRVKILFEDDISWYVESLTEKDAKGHGKRFSVKKHCFVLRPVKKVAMEMFEEWNKSNPFYLPLQENTIKSERRLTWRAALEHVLNSDPQEGTVFDMIERELGRRE